MTINIHYRQNIWNCCHHHLIVIEYSYHTDWIMSSCLNLRSHRFFSGSPCGNRQEQGLSESRPRPGTEPFSQKFKLHKLRFSATSLVWNWEPYGFLFLRLFCFDTVACSCLWECTWFGTFQWSMWHFFGGRYSYTMSLGFCFYHVHIAYILKLEDVKKSIPINISFFKSVSWNEWSDTLEHWLIIYVI